MKTTLVLFGAIVFGSGILAAQVPVHSLAFGVEVGQLSTVQIAYTPLARFQLSAQMGPIAQIGETEYLKPTNLGVTTKYFFSEGESSVYLGLTAFTQQNRQYKYGVGIPLGMQHFVSDKVAFFGHMTTAKTDQNDSLTMFAGFGVTFYLK